VADATVTFALATDTTSQFASFPSNVTNTKSPTKKAISVSDIDWTVATHSSDSGGFGIKLDAQPKDQSWYVTSQTTVDGTVSSSTTVVLDSVDNLAVGVTITAVSAGSLSGTPTITAIDLDTKKITMSGAQSFNDGITLTFRALGGALIKATQGVDLEFIDMTAALVQLTTTVRTDNSGDTVVDVNGTYGISAGATVRGVNIDNSSSNPLVAISASSTAGTITFTENQTVKAGTKLYIDGSGLQGTIKGKINIRKFPSSNVTVYFRADATFTQGAAS
jgi:Cu/Ag efflux protein CusF